MPYALKAPDLFRNSGRVRGLASPGGKRPTHRIVLWNSRAL